MYDFSVLCEKIRMPQEVTALLHTGPGDDALGFQTLHAHLTAACGSWTRYQALGISEEIFIATMGAFSRFVREHRESFGMYGFDRGFWTTRQTGCVLFRIGQLEYELKEEDGTRSVALHIPSDASLELPSLRSSLNDALILIRRCFPEYADTPMTCHSWLLSPDLPELLPQGSRILAFQQSFTVTKTDTGPEFKQWVYGRVDIPDEYLPEDTTLQKNLKAFLRSGHPFRTGHGILNQNPFVDETMGQC